MDAESNIENGFLSLNDIEKLYSWGYRRVATDIMQKWTKDKDFYHFVEVSEDNGLKIYVDGVLIYG